MARANSLRRTLRQFDREDPDTRELARLRQLVAGNDDRTAAIVSASDLEDSLEQAIRKRMRSLSTEEYNGLFFGDSPLATF